MLRIRIRIRNHRIYVFLGLLDPDPLIRGMDLDAGSFYHWGKIVRKTLISTVLWLLFDFLPLKNDVKVPSKSNMQKNFFLKLVFVGILKVNDGNRRIRIRIRIGVWKVLMNFFIDYKIFFTVIMSPFKFFRDFHYPETPHLDRKAKTNADVSGSKHGYRRNRPEHHLPGNNGV